MRWVLGCALLGATVVISGCGDAAGGRGPGGGSDSAGGKADDVDEAEALSHADRVAACDLAAQRHDRDNPTEAELLQIEYERRDCIAGVNDAVVPMIDEALEDADHEGAGFTFRVLGDNRDTASSMCRQIAKAGDDPVGSRAELASARCEATMERNLADLIGRHVDLGEDPIALPGAYRRYRACYSSLDEPSDDDESADDDNDQVVQEQIAAFDRLANCIHAADAALTVEMGDRMAEALGGDAVRHGESVFDLLQDHRARLDVVCLHFAYAGPRRADPVEVEQHRCLIAGLEARGRLIEEITGLVPDHDGEPGPNPDPDPDPDPGPVPTGEPGRACYPGADGKWDTCFDVVTVDAANYGYASGFGGNPNYRPPIAFLDVEAVDGSIKIAPSFTLGEIAVLNKGRYAVVQPHAIASLQQLRDKIGPLSVNSGYRSPAYNTSVGGATFSRHMYGDGFDFSPTEASLSAGESACTELGGKLVQYNSHVHCDFRYDAVDTTFFGPATAASIYEGPRLDARLEWNGGQWEAPAEGFDEGEPRRSWTALDDEGFVIGRHRGDQFAPPPGTATVRVVVGGVVELEQAVTESRAPVH